MLDLLKKTVLTGIGIAALTKEKVKDFAKKIVKEKKLTEEEGKKLVKDMLKKSDEARKDMEGLVEKFVKNALKKLDIPSKENLQRIEDRIKKLENLNQKKENRNNNL